MPKAHATRNLEARRAFERAHWPPKQTLAWIADRSLDRINTTYREWRNGYYEYPQLPDWHSKDPLIWNWCSPVGELDEAAQALRQECEAGALRGTGREGVGGPRCEIASLRWLDLMLVDIAGVTDGPQLYDSSANPLAIMDGRAEPAFYNVLFVVADAVKAFPASAEQSAMADTSEPAAPKPKDVEFDDLEEAYRGLSGKVRNKSEADKLIQGKDYFNQSISKKMREGARKAARFVGIMGAPPKK